MEQDSLHYITFEIVRWVDIFTRKVYRDIVIDSLRYSQENKGLEIYAFVIMSNHIHLLIRSDIGKLSDTIREFKSFTAKQILLAIDSESESRREWMLNLFEFAANSTSAMRNIKFGLMRTMQSLFLVINLFFRRSTISTKIRCVQVLLKKQKITCIPVPAVLQADLVY